MLVPRVLAKTIPNQKLSLALVWRMISSFSCGCCKGGRFSQRTLICLIISSSSSMNYQILLELVLGDNIAVNLEIFGIKSLP